jgi:hypothetical protein
MRMGRARFTVGDQMIEITQGIHDKNSKNIHLVRPPKAPLRGVAGYTEAHACAWHICQPALSDPSLPASYWFTYFK